MKPKASVAGRSMLFNAIFITMNLIGAFLLLIGFHDFFSGNKSLFKITGFTLFIFSIGGLIVFKGRIAISNVVRVIVGSVFIVSGLVKANDPIGFSYKLQEYFEDGALAYRIKEWFGMPEFSLEGLGESALSLSVIICVLEIVLGVMTVFGQRMKGVSILLVGMMLFFTFLTWHTDNCDAGHKFTDRNRYSLTNPIGQSLVNKAKADPDITIVSMAGELVIDEVMSPQCVNDCGCFGDAMKGSIGRSLTPAESFWKDLILLYFSLWILFAAFKKNQVPEKNKKYYWISSLVLIGLLSWLFGWVFPILFAFVAFFGSIWFLRNETTNPRSFFYLTSFITVLSTLIVVYVLLYEPIKDYRPYSVGSNLKAKMNDGVQGEYLDFLTYRNIKTGQTKEYEASSTEYTLSKVWEDKDWKYIDKKQIVLSPTRLSSITTQFSPFIPIEMISDDYASLPFVNEKLKNGNEQIVRLYNTYLDTTVSLALGDTSILSEEYKRFKIVDTVERRREYFTEIQVRDDILNEEKLIILSVRNLMDADWSEIKKLKDILKKSQKDNIPMLMLVSASLEDVKVFKEKYDFHIPVFLTDETEMKVIARSFPSLMVLKKGIVKGKYPKRALPDYKWLELNVLK